MSSYDHNFYDFIKEGSLRSARVVIPLVQSLIDDIKSVVDVGCGEGAWLSVWKDAGVPEVQGFDGDYVETSRLLIDSTEFQPVNLEQPPEWILRYDLCQSLEVGEHLPESSAESYVDFLTSLSDNILFSAAIPGQMGRDHINEQWPDYWDAKFQARGYRGTNYIRETIWENPEVENWYKQNTLLYMKNVPDHLSNLFEAPIDDRIHPNNTHIIGR